MDKLMLLGDIMRTHAALEAAAASLADTDLMAEVPGMDGWTRKDVLAHVAWWSEHSAGVIEALLAGREPYPADGTPFDIDAHNAKVRAESRSRSLAAVRLAEADGYRRVVAAVDAATAADLFEPGRFAWLGGEPLVRTVASDTSEHYAEHLPHLALG